MFLAMQDSEDASLSAPPDFTRHMNPAFELTDEEGTIRADVYLWEPVAQEDTMITRTDEDSVDDVVSPSIGEDSTGMVIGHFSNGSDDSLIFPFSPHLEATIDIADDAAIEPLSLYDFPQFERRGGDSDAFEYEETDGDHQAHGEAFSPFPYAAWNNDNQEAHIEL